jgi:Domain of unknown function (DUF5134)
MMVALLPARCLLTAVFAAAGLGALPPRGRAGTAPAEDRVAAAFRVLMCAALTAMTWRSEPAPARWLQSALFGCAVIWFGLASPGQTARFWPTSLPGAHHALMAGAMIWMITAMPGAMPMVPGMAASTAMATMSYPAIPAAVLAVSALLAAYFALAAIAWLVRAICPGRRVNSRAAASHAAMSADMAAMLMAML